MPKLRVLGTCNDSSQRADEMLCYRSVLMLLTMLAEVSTSPAFQQKTHRFEQFHAQKDFILGTTATTFFFGQGKEKEKKNPSRHSIFASKRPISLLQGDELECPPGNREVPRTAKRLIKSQYSQQVH